jgi:hypothetical protein
MRSQDENSPHKKKARELKEFYDLNQSLRDFHPLVLDSHHMSLDCCSYPLIKWNQSLVIIRTCKSSELIPSFMKCHTHFRIKEPLVPVFFKRKTPWKNQQFSWNNWEFYRTLFDWFFRLLEKWWLCIRIWGSWICENLQFYISEPVYLILGFVKF